MRLLIILAIIFCAIGGGWYAGEGYLARKAQEALGAGSPITATKIAPLRQPDRIGVQLSDLVFTGPASTINAPELRVYAPLLAPTTLTADLPTTVDIRANGASSGLVLGLSGGKAEMRLSPMHDMQITRLSGNSGPMTMDGAPLAQSLKVDAVLGALSYDSPKPAHAAYDLSIDLAGLDPKGLPQMANANLPEGLIGIHGTGRMWLTEAMSPQAAPDAARPVGLRADGVTLSIGEISARVLGRVERAEDGTTEGKVMIYTASVDPILEFAAETGLLPQKRLPLVKTMLSTLSQLPEHNASPTQRADFAGHIDDVSTSAPAFPAPSDGEIRLPLIFEGGKMMLGPIPLGPSPVFPGWAESN